MEPASETLSAKVSQINLHKMKMEGRAVFLGLLIWEKALIMKQIPHSYWAALYLKGVPRYGGSCYSIY